VCHAPIQVQTLHVQRDTDLVGQRIRVSAAAHKYHVAQPMLTRWADRGLIAILRRAPRVLELDEADVKLATDLYATLLTYTNPKAAGHLLNTLLQ